MNCKFCIDEELIKDIIDPFAFNCNKCKAYFSYYSYDGLRFSGVNLSDCGRDWIKYRLNQIIITVNFNKKEYEYNLKNLSEIELRDFLIKFYDNLEFL